MTSSASYMPPPRPQGWLSKSELWLDSHGKGAWIAAMVLAFVFFWPLGLALLAYMIWSKRMFSAPCRTRRTANETPRSFRRMKTTGNSAFDAYREDTLRRLEQEQNDFESFLGRLRAAKDKAEFDQFMQERADQDPSVSDAPDVAPEDDTPRG